MSRRLPRAAAWLGHAAAIAALVSAVTAAAPRTQAPRQARRPRSTRRLAQPASTPACGDGVAVQVRLDRSGISPGEIDGHLGPNARRALAAFQQAKGLTQDGQADCDTWAALGGDTAEPALLPYEITADDVRGPFIHSVPRDPDLQARLPALRYTSVLEEISERFHAAPALIKRLNMRARFEAGEQIRVPAVTPFDAAAKLPHDPDAGDISVAVSRAESSVRVTRADGTLVFFAPVTTGSTHDPLPPGNWKVTSIDWHPAFHYNPNLFWDSSPGEASVMIKPGPNNPVGVVWIGLDLGHYGLHGTPEPSAIGRTTSHGCVRLTNWDAAHLASLVQPGTPVVFQ